uniref:Uncharacterized protein n=1 Tax=Sparus aurata TaxID=8175 RepID=A0A671XEM2_SPAAU
FVSTLSRPVLWSRQTSPLLTNDDQFNSCNMYQQLMMIVCYLTRKKLCGRVPVQSFIDASEEEVKRICQGVGSHNGCNLFSSNSIMTVYNVRSKLVNQHCQVASLPEPRQQEVVVACSKFQNQCLPVHYEAYRNQQPANVRCS